MPVVGWRLLHRSPAVQPGAGHGSSDLGVIRFDTLWDRLGGAG
jgi:hypothetical protein